MTLENRHVRSAHVVALAVVIGWPVLFHIAFRTLNLEILTNEGVQALTHIVAGVQAIAALVLAIWTVRSFRGFSRWGGVLSMVSTALQFAVIFVVHRGLISLLKW